MRLLLPFSKPLAYVTPTMWAKAIWQKSWTKLLGWLTAIPSSLLLAASEINSYISDPFFKSYLDVIHVPQAVTIAFATLGVLIWLAHGREND